MWRFHDFISGVKFCINTFIKRTISGYYRSLKKCNDDDDAKNFQIRTEFKQI